VDLKALGDLQLPDEKSQLRRLGDFWSDRPVVLVFLRHFG
jgi:hypothetical protein